MKRYFLCRADQLHASLEVFFRENPGWEDAFVSADKDGIYAIRAQYADNGSHLFFDTKAILEVGHGRSNSDSPE